MLDYEGLAAVAKGVLGLERRTLTIGEKDIPATWTLRVSPACRVPSSFCELMVMDLICVRAQSGYLAKSINYRACQRFEILASMAK